MSKKIRVNITVDSELLDKAKKKLHLFGGKLSTLFNAYLSDFVDSIDVNLIKSTLRIYKLKVYNSSNQTTDSSTGYYANCDNGNGYDADVGELLLNNNIVFKKAYPTGIQQPDSMYSYGLNNYDVMFNSTNYTWYASGSNQFSTFQITTTSPQYELEITYPQANQNINRNDSLVITWNLGIKMPCNKIILYIGNSNHTFYAYVEDTGSYTIYANDLIQFSSGDVTIDITAGNYTISNYSSYYMLSVVYSEHIIPIHLY